MNKRQANKRRLAQAVTHFQASVLPAPAVDEYSDAAAVASLATRANHDGSRRHSGIVDATGTTNLTSATRSGWVYALHALNIQGAVLGEKINTGSRSQSESKRAALDPRWGMTTAESNPALWVKPTE